MRMPLIPHNGPRPFRQTRCVFLLCAVVLVGSSAFRPPAEPAMTVVIDAGHGGIDPGNLGTGRYKTVEKHINLIVAKKTAAYIEERIPGVRVIMTRTDDSFPELPDRVRVANDAKADLLLSIHCDSFAKSSAYGSGTFVMGLDKSEASLRVASKENASVFQENADGGFDPEDPDTFIALALRQEIYLGRSLQLAEMIQTQFRERVGRKDRGVRQAPYYVTAYANMPSVLVELGFLTNPDEEDFLHSEQGQDYMASALFRAFRDYAKQWFNVESTVADTPESEEPAAKGKEGASDSASPAPTDTHPTTTEVAAIDTEAAETETASSWRGVLHADCDTAPCFSIQAASSRNGQPLHGEDGLPVPHATAVRSGSVYKYRVASTSSYAEACRMRDTLRVNGFPDAFVVAFDGDRRIPLEDALKRAKD